MVVALDNNVPGGFWVGKVQSGFGLRAGFVSDIITTTNYPTIGTWCHTVIARRGARLDLYINGVSITNITSSYSFVKSSLWIGVDNPSMPPNISTYGNSTISSVRLYNTIGLTAEQVSQNFNAHRSRYGI